MVKQLEDNHPLVLKELQSLSKELNRFLGLTFNGLTVESMKQVIQDHRVAFKRQYGLEFPPLVPFVLPSIKLVIFYRSDLTDQEIRNKLLMLLRDLARKKVSISAFEIYNAVKSAWPKHKPPIEEMRKDPKLSINTLQ